MKAQFYFNEDNIIAGSTLKDPYELESNNMALHVCDNPKNILINREKLASALQCDIRQFVCANQTHSANFYHVTSDDIGRGAFDTKTAISDTDALYTYEPNIVLCIFTADCVPVIFYDETNYLIGVIHSGWQGTVKEVTLKIFQHLIEEEQCNPKQIHVQIGAALSQEKFEVDEDVYVKFKKLGYTDAFIYFNEPSNKYHIDNQQVVKRQCEMAGIPSENIHVDPTCTFTSLEGFSYRQNKQDGRHLSFIMRKEHE